MTDQLFAGHRRVLARAPAVLVVVSCLFVPPRAWAIEHFIVFFPKQSCTILAEGGSVIAEFAGAAKKLGAPRVIVVGHAGEDEGSPDERVQLSQCRADAVKAQLIKEGVDAVKIAVSARGDSEPLSTLFGGDQRMNRYVTLDRE